MSSEDGESPDAEAGPGGQIIDQSIEQELAESYLTYAMSTIVDRALPDVRDGLKPSQRRILVAMNDLNLSPGRAHAKCAGIVGETMKKYHPHGDQAIYPTLVNMAQDWKIRYPLVDKQGNFGSIDPDPPAAMRYTEARLHRHAMEMLEDLKLETVDWQPNFDETMDEPKVLPSKFPNLLVNGSTGIAVGMASSIPPHNLGEICDAIVATLDNPGITPRELLEHLPAPDFPTGGKICGRRGVAEAYASGRGRITVRARIEHEQGKDGRPRLVITEIPYQLTKNDGIVSKIVECRKHERITDISDIVDESSRRTGMRVVIHLKRGADPHAVENQLYRLTPLQTTHSIMIIALVHGEPRTLTMKDLIQAFIGHRFEVIRRRTAYRLREAQQQAHRIEGLIYAVVDIDEVIRLIRESRTREEATEKLLERGFRIPPDHPYAPQIPERLKNASAEEDARLTRVQAEAIGRLQLIQLVGLEIERLTSEYAKLLEQIEEYEAILASDERVRQIVRDETLELRGRYADKRRTEILEEEPGALDLAELTPEHRVVVTITHQGYIKRLPVEQYRTQARGGRGVIGTGTKEDDFPEQVFVASTHDDVLCFTDTGRVYRVKVYEIPEASRTSRGRAMANLLELRAGERICACMPIEDFERGEHFLAFATAQGLIKRTPLRDYRNVKRSGIHAIHLRPEDTLIGVSCTSGEDHLLLDTAGGVAIRFEEQAVRPMSRQATGVKGISLADGDEVVSLVRVEPGDPRDLLTVTDRGYGKRTPLGEYLVHSEDGRSWPQGRGGKGRRDMATSANRGRVVTSLAVRETDDIMLVTRNGMVVRTRAGSIRRTGRGAQGVRVIRLAGDDRLAGLARVAEPNRDAGDG